MSISDTASQCDEARPACGRCVKAKRVCTGYAEGLDLVLRNQNGSAKAQVDRRLKLYGKSESSNQSASPERRIAYRSQYPIDASFLAESEETHARAFFVSSFALYRRDTQADRGFIELIPLLCGNLRDGSPLDLALTTASHTIYSKWERRHKDAETRSIPGYGRALQATRKALGDPNENMSDETLMAVCLLGFYEVGYHSGGS